MLARANLYAEYDGQRCESGLNSTLTPAYRIHTTESPARLRFAFRLHKAALTQDSMSRNDRGPVDNPRLNQLESPMRYDVDETTRLTRSIRTALS
jgi:hypothetical protein